MTLAAETPPTMSESDRFSRPSSAPPEAEDDSLDALATRILARARGVVEPAPANIGRAVRRALVRFLALPLGLVIGAVLGVVLAPFALLASSPWRTRLVRFLAAPLAGPSVGAFIGWRLLVKGRVDALPIVATLLHRFVPVVAFPRAVTHHLFGLVLVTRYEDVRLVLEREDIFRVDGYDDRMRATTGAFLLGLDPGPTYDKEQRLAAAAVGREIEPLSRLVAGLSRELVDKSFDRSRTLDVVTELAHAVQLAVYDRFFGIPNTRDERLIPWLETTSYFVFNLWIGGPYRAAAIEAGRELAAHLRRVVRRRIEELAHGAPSRPDVLGRLLDAVRATSGDPKLPTNEDLAVRIMAGLISGAGVPTTGLFITAVDFLLSLPADERAALKKAAHLNDDATVKRFLFEAARFYAFPPSLYRHAAMPYVFHAGTKHEAVAERGAWVVTLPVLANYDARVFPNAGTFNPMREYPAGRGPLLFGWGQHQCLGPHLAELTVLEMAKPLFAKGIARAPEPDGMLTKGERGIIPDGDFDRRLVVRFD
jgi:cytochrome P450